jgi:hypothetical protein
VDPESQEWYEWARGTLGYLGLSLHETEGLTETELRAQLSFRTGAIAGALLKFGPPGALRDLWTGLKEEPGS